MGLRSRTAAVAVLLLGGLAGALVAAAVRADVAFEATVQPNEISSLKTRELSYRLRMTTGGRRERFRVRVEQPIWDPVSARGPNGFAAVPDCFRRPLVLRGRGRLTATVCEPKPARDPRCGRGGSFWKLSGEVALPAHSTSTLAARFLTAGPPLLRTDYRATFVVGGGRNDTLTGVQEIRPPTPAGLGPFGTYITLGTRPGTPYFPGRRRFRRGKMINIRGRTERSLAGQLMRLRYTYLPSRGASRQLTFARVRIDGRGRFSYPGWRPGRPGSYRLYAVYRPRSRDRISDQSCSRGLIVGG